jgi:hypothetical protein
MLPIYSHIIINKDCYIYYTRFTIIELKNKLNIFNFERFELQNVDNLIKKILQNCKDIISIGNINNHNRYYTYILQKLTENKLPLKSLNYKTVESEHIFNFLYWYNNLENISIKKTYRNNLENTIELLENTNQNTCDYNLGYNFLLMSLFKILENTKSVFYQLPTNDKTPGRKELNNNTTVFKRESVRNIKKMFCDTEEDDWNKLLYG